MGLKRGSLHLRSVERQDFRSLFWGDHEGISFPIKMEKLQGSTPYDFIQCSASSFILISENVYQLLKDERVTGWKIYSIELPSSIKFDKKYFGLSITGRCGAIDNSRSIETLMPPLMPNAPKRLTHLGIYFDENTHDGTDLFCPEGTSYIFTNDRIKNLFEKYEITNCYFRPQSEIENFNVKK